VSNLVKAIGRNKHAYLFLVPTFLFLGTFSYYPPISAMIHAFFRWDGVGSGVFVGLDNFRELLTRDEFFIRSCLNVCILLTFNVLKTITMPFLVAELIYWLWRERARYAYRVIFILPMVTPGIVVTLLWKFIYDTHIGPLNRFLTGVGLEHLAMPWLASTKIALYSLAAVGFPWAGGIGVLIYLAGLHNIPADIFDAARVDGAGWLRRLVRIDFPLVLAQVRVLTVMTVLGTIQGFETVMIMTKGGPGFSTLVPGLYMYRQAFQYGRFGYATAIGLLMFLGILFFTYANLKLVRTRE
jgi:raffinose/stachyose/melibiose transport system permease protein